VLDAAVLCCVPLSRESWLDRAHSDYHGDFVRSFSAERFERDYESAWSYFRTEAEFIGRKLDLLATWGVSVYRDATSADLKMASSERRDIAVVAHWKGETVLEEDIQHPRHVLEHARLLLPEFHFDPTKNIDSATDVAQSLEAFVVEALRWTSEGRPTVDSVLASISRRELLNGIPGLASGNRVEMWDGMLSRTEFAAFLDREKLRTLFLAICTSNYLLEATRLANPRAICLGSRETVRADISLSKLTAALNLCRLERKPLWRCLVTAAEMFDQLGNWS
jgi:hypothetical protein